MTHRFLVKQIALQAGVGVATVDRVLHQREHVREHTRQRVMVAIQELERQQFQLAAHGRKLLIEVVVEAPRRFSDEIRSALEAELPGLHPVIFRPRFKLQETISDDELLASLERIGRRGSHGVLLKARDTPALNIAVAKLQQQGIPVVTVFTDLPASSRLAYAGLDNRMAGATAAYLISQWLPAKRGKVLVTMSDQHFRGEEERLLSFRAALQARCPQLGLLDASGGHGLDSSTEARVRAVATGSAPIQAVYSMGGGNRAILRALDALGQRPPVFIGHDLDRDNRQLLREQRLSAVLHHDVGHDMRAACQHLMNYHRLLPAAAISGRSLIQIVTPENIPP